MLYLLYQTMPRVSSIANGECLNEKNYFSYFSRFLSYRYLLRINVVNKKEKVSTIIMRFSGNNQP